MATEKTEKKKTKTKKAGKSIEKKRRGRTAAFGKLKGGKVIPLESEKVTPRAQGAIDAVFRALRENGANAVMLLVGPGKSRTFVSSSTGSRTVTNTKLARDYFALAIEKLEGTAEVESEVEVDEAEQDAVEQAADEQGEPGTC